MASLSSDQLLSALRAAQWTSDELTRLRDWIASIRHPGECLGLLEAAAHERGCPHCGCERAHPAARPAACNVFAVSAAVEVTTR